MTMETKVEEVLRARLGEIDAERDKLLALLAHYSAGDKPSENGATRKAAPQKKSMRRIGGNPFQPRPGGPTERILEVVRSRPGLTWSEIIEEVLTDLETEAKNPRRSVGSTIGSLVKAGKLQRRDGKHFIPRGEQELGL